MTAESDDKALGLFLAAVPIEKIKTQMGYRSTTSANAAITRALKAAQSGKNPDTARATEIERLDSLYRQIYPLALQQDSKAIDQCLKISEQRLRLLDAPAKAQKGLLKAYEDTVKALAGNIEPEDKAVVQTGRMIASQIDYAVTHGIGQEVTKALYLVPHLMNVLQALGATPEARRQLQDYAGETREAKKAEPVDELTAFRLKRFGT
ncbi:terminase small subunit [Bifidobacterium biavatii]|uniref:Terminase small subunit actinomycetes phage-type domain-containing protein n=1 Tax=Bifidobacterium biavatii DSM 23969 TaxID=1437608 RepID=A0A086ZTV0_9BIFI|nr:hypothetical protein [Bifidobacterium biavatii]KFI49950.1 hypothetical protein BBIA_1872 [Bifidobacterium biavatii DSM 23969]